MPAISTLTSTTLICLLLLLLCSESTSRPYVSYLSTLVALSFL